MRKRHASTQSALVIAVLYAVIGGLWILLSDKAVEQAFRDPDTIIRVSMLKGWLYVGATSLLLFFLVRHYLARLQASLQREIDHYVEKQHSLELLTAIADHSEAAIFAKDLQGRYLLFNPAASRYVGQSIADVLGHDDRAIFPPEQAAALIATGERIVASGRMETCEEQLDTALGPRTFHTTRGPLRNAGQAISGHFGISRDITAMKLAEKALQENAERLHLLIQYAPAALAMFDRAMCYLVASERWLKEFGLTGRNIVGHSHYAVFPEIGEDLKALHQRGLAGECRSADEERFERADGTVQWLRWAMRPWHAADGTVGGIVIFTEDISARKAAEEALQATADNLEATVQAIPDLLLEMDGDGRYLRVKATRKNLLAAPPDQLLGRTVAEMLPPEAAKTVLEALKAASRLGTDYGRTILLPLAHGPHHFEISVARKPTPAGQPQRFVVVSRDITARKRVEEQLRQRNEELERFHRATVGREMDMLELKKTVNALSLELGRAPPHPLAFLQNEGGTGTP